MKTIQQIKDHLSDLTPIFGFNPALVEQGSDDWKILKLGVISATGADAITKVGRGGKPSGTRQSYLCKKVGEVCTCLMAPISSKQMEWGTDNESKAKASYDFRNDNGMVIVPIVFKELSTDVEDLRALASPDGINVPSGLEIKCPYTTEVYIQFLVDGIIKPEYIKQVQFLMWVTAREYWDFANFDPRMKWKPFHTVRFYRDDKLMKTFDDAVPQAIADMDVMLERVGVKFGDHWARLLEEREEAI